ncbi:MAG: CapA family protein [Acidimicrobiales bacterium]|nr:CapA family protein [Acidimicrobiales bacterium]
MAGAHLRGGRRGSARRLVVLALLAFVVGLVLGGGATTLFVLDDDGDAGVETGDDDTDPGTADLVPGGAGAAVATPDPGPITLAFVGDINVEGSLATRLEEMPGQFVGPFADVLGDADLAVGNLEAALVTGGTPLDKEFVFDAPPGVLGALTAGGIDVASAANNHAMDYGTDGLAETLGLKADADGSLIGIGADEGEAYAPYLAQVGGQRVAVIAATQVIDAELIESWTATEEQGGVASAKRVDRLVAEVAAARASADTVVVFLHWGIETETCPSASQQELAQTLADAGADVIVGGHAHRVQGAGRLGDAFVGYGLGNFLFGAVSEESAKSGVLLVEVDGREVTGYEWRPGRIAERVPMPLEGEEAEVAIAEWNDLRGCTNLAE